ncbi:MAG: flagellin [Clostridiales bacterium]|nr:flagellin [Clostridiales bacterium]
MTGSGAEISAYIGIVDSALDTVSAMRGRIGAVQNRLGFTKSMLDVCSENLSAAESRITDADMGKEMMKLAMATFLEQVGVMLLAQANQSAELVLRLLR